MEPFSSEDWRGADERQALRPEPVLPQGAMRPRSSHSGTVPTLSYTPVRPASPSSEPSHTPEPDKVQFATYPPDEKAKPWDAEPSASRNGKGKGKKDIAWLPVPLRTWFWVSFVVDLVAIAIALEVVLYFTDKNNGWPVRGAFSSQAGFMHYVYTLPPVAVAMILVAMWAWADVEIKKMQPYVDLVHGDAPAHRSVLLDYTRTNNFIVWLRAAANKHYIVALATLMVILSLALQPLAAALLTVRDTWLSKPDQILNNTAVLALNQDDQFWDVTSFLTAAGYSSASVLYSLGDPHFVHNGYTVAPFQLPTYLATNGTVYTNTTAVLSDPGCQPAQSIQMTHNTNNDTWTISADYPGCPYTWDVSRVAENLFGVAPCNVPGDTTPDFLRPVLFWYFTYVPSAMSSITFCKPTISLYNVAVTVDLASGNLTSVTQLSPLKVGQGNFTAYAGNITGSPLNGAAYNGIAYNLSNPDPFTMARVNATQLTLPAAVFQSATTSAQGLTGVFTNNGFVGLTNSVYRTYLALVAKTVYFVPNSEPITLQVKTVEKRLWLSSVAVHLLTTALLLLAFFGTIVQLLHRGDRANLRLAHEPGTIASAVVVGAQTNMGELLSGRQRKEEIIQALRDKRFRINPRTMKIVMEGEEGYEEAASPGPRRSVFAAGLLDLMSPHPASRRFSRPPPMPQTPP
ncbi:hypothetical protein GLOTRDRAFT_78464 [Gloeophyllum trabeum ATCC 11539]|uniref:Uncharacterized protein n=1 Tax=Gloeophyllum trabeum (strain ATCC 11539 / FP-39264 / Madison 617) TaxID=670483 RepID=S7RLC3_GLOTA|nr:uncharacterized protein GLOTRDRAFT_78464 [Gloeophyllum trabeum ATCC 11539]EPQ53464.1 hypothetical protein GLOTRDRAFT_78464 [Gloeophyllum trabeum ATCC 11539]